MRQTEEQRLSADQPQTDMTLLEKRVLTKTTQTKKLNSVKISYCSVG